MYRHSQQGPWPIIDTGYSLVTRGTGSAVTSIASAHNICFDTANLGSGPECFTNAIYGASISLAAQEQCSFGVCLAPLTNYGNGQDIYIDYCISVNFVDEVAHAVPFLWTLDGALTPINGWSVGDNASTDEYILPISCCHVNLMTSQGQILIKDIFGSLDPEDYIAIGFALRANGFQDTATLDNVQYTISARYGYKSFPTFDQER